MPLPPLFSDVFYFLPPSSPVKTLPNSSAASLFWAVDFFLAVEADFFAVVVFFLAVEAVFLAVVVFFAAEVDFLAVVFLL